MAAYHTRAATAASSARWNRPPPPVSTRYSPALTAANRAWYADDPGATGKIYVPSHQNIRRSATQQPGRIDRTPQTSAARRPSSLQGPGQRAKASRKAGGCKLALTGDRQGNQPRPAFQNEDGGCQGLIKMADAEAFLRIDGSRQTAVSLLLLLLWLLLLSGQILGTRSAVLATKRKRLD